MRPKRYLVGCKLLIFPVSSLDSMRWIVWQWNGAVPPWLLNDDYYHPSETLIEDRSIAGDLFLCIESMIWEFAAAESKVGTLRNVLSAFYLPASVLAYLPLGTAEQFSSLLHSHCPLVRSNFTFPFLYPTLDRILCVWAHEQSECFVGIWIVFLFKNREKPVNCFGIYELNS